jgi:hypothetical protein
MMQTLLQKHTSRPLTSIPHAALQRKCACGGNPGPSGECEECRKKRLGMVQRSAVASAPAGFAPPVVHNVLQSPGAFPGLQMRLPMEARSGHDFAEMAVFPPVHTNSAEDGPETSDPTGEGTNQEPQDNPIGSERPVSVPILANESGAEALDSQSGKAACPTKTVVEKVIDMTPAGIQKGYHTGYGATAVIRVEPTSTNWDGTKIKESNKQTKNTCPPEFGISPCSGADTFTVGAESNSSILGKLPAIQNRFYDFHISRWNKGSLLHDRNPNNVASCEVECEQQYSCGGNVIGTHKVTRTFTKGKNGSLDVTLVNVTKS